MYKIVINRCFGGFSLSKKASMLLNEQYGTNVDSEYGYTDCHDIPRHHKGLVEIVETLGTSANGMCAALKVVCLHSPVYRIHDYDGMEEVEELGDESSWTIISE